MGLERGSLLLKERAELETAPFLFSEDELPKIDKTKPKFHCTGDRFFRDRPDIYKAVVRLLAEPGVTIRTICQECHVTDDLVRSVKARENIPIAHEKKNVLASITHGLRLASERVIEVMPTASPRDALIGVGILGEKMQLLGGDATARIETNVNIDFHAELTHLLEEAKQKVETIKQAKAIEIGVDGKDSEQKALTNGDQEQPCGADAQNAADAQDGAGNGDFRPAATLVADEPATLNQAQI